MKKKNGSQEEARRRRPMMYTTIYCDPDHFAEMQKEIVKVGDKHVKDGDGWVWDINTGWVTEECAICGLELDSNLHYVEDKDGWLVHSECLANADWKRTMEEEGE